MSHYDFRDSQMSNTSATPFASVYGHPQISVSTNGYHMIRYTPDNDSQCLLDLHQHQRSVPIVHLATAIQVSKGHGCMGIDCMWHGQSIIGAVSVTSDSVRYNSCHKNRGHSRVHGSFLHRAFARWQLTSSKGASAIRASLQIAAAGVLFTCCNAATAIRASLQTEATEDLMPCCLLYTSPSPRDRG